MELEKRKSVLECLLFVTNHPLKLDDIADFLDIKEAEAESLIREIQADLESRKSALQIAAVAEGYQFATREGYSYWVKKLYRDQTTFKLSQSALETLSIIAYKQPITRAEIEEIRGVEVTGVLETLVERHLAKIVGRKESVGRPLLYGTTQEFLRHFHLWRISELPSLEDLAREAERMKAAEKTAAAAGTPGAEDAPGEAAAVPAEPAPFPAEETAEPGPDGGDVSGGDVSPGDETASNN